MSQFADSELQGQPYLSEPEPNERFSLSRLAWMSYVFGASVIILMSQFQSTAAYPPARLVPYVLGKLSGLFIVSILTALLAFYISKRSQKAASMTFIAFVVLGTMGQVLNVARNGGKTLDDEAVFNRILPIFSRWMEEQVAPYQHACEKMAEKWPMNPFWLKERSDLVSAREQIVCVRTANDELRDLFDRIAPMIRKELAAQGVPERDRSRLTTVISNQLSKATIHYATMRDMDEALNSELLKACDLLDENWGHWHYDTNKYTTIFEDDAVNKEFNVIQANIQRLTQEWQRASVALQAMQR